MKALYAFAFVCLSAPALAGSLGSPAAAIDTAEIWHEFDYDLKDGIKVAKTYPSTQELALELKREIRTAEIWHEFDYDLKDGIKVAKTYPSTNELLADLNRAIVLAEIWHEFDYDLKDGIKVAKTYPSTIDQEADPEMTASIPETAKSPRD
jgi:hypothetical protein